MQAPFMVLVVHSRGSVVFLSFSCGLADHAGVPYLVGSWFGFFKVALGL